MNRKRRRAEVVRLVSEHLQRVGGPVNSHDLIDLLWNRTQYALTAVSLGQLLRQSCARGLIERDANSNVFTTYRWVGPES